MYRQPATSVFGGVVMGLEAYDGEMRLTFQTVENGQLQDRGTSRWVSPE